MAACRVWPADFGALEWHSWTCRADAPDRPSYVLFDLDPGERTIVPSCPSSRG